jgi:hypothetical protein
LNQVVIPTAGGEIMPKEKRFNFKEGEIPDPEWIAEILVTVRKEVPGLLRDIINILYSEQSAKNMGKAVGVYYKTLQANGIPKEIALEMTKGYVFDLGRMFSKKNFDINGHFGGHHHE